MPSGLIPISMTQPHLWGHVSIFKVPDGYVDPDYRALSEDELRRHLLTREGWEKVAHTNTITEFGKDYLWQFALRAASRSTSQPLHATASLENDDYVTKMAVGDKVNPGPPDPTAFTGPDDTIQSYRGRGNVVLSLDVDPAIAPHAVQVEARFDGTDIFPAIEDSAFTLTEAALVTHNSDDESGDNPGNRVVAYCTFEETPLPVAATDRVSIRWIVGMS